jgi:hypothetical protein
MIGRIGRLAAAEKMGSKDGWPMLITADETGPGWLPFVVGPAIFSPTLSSIDSVP